MFKGHHNMGSCIWAETHWSKSYLIISFFKLELVSQLRGSVLPMWNLESGQLQDTSWEMCLAIRRLCRKAIIISIIILFKGNGKGVFCTEKGTSGENLVCRVWEHKTVKL